MCHWCLSLAFCEFFGLCDPVFTTDATFERQFLFDSFDVSVCPSSDLCEGCDAFTVQLANDDGANTGDLAQIVGTFGCWCSFGLLRLGRLGRFLFGLVVLHALGHFGLIGFVQRITLFHGCHGSSADGTGADCRFDVGFIRAGGQDLADFDQCQLLTVAFGTLGRVLPAALDEVNDFLALDLIDDLGLNAGPCDQRSTQLGGIAAQHENFVELDCFARVSSQTFYPQHIAGLNFVLLAACLDDRKHASSFSVIRVLWPPLGSLWMAFRPIRLEQRALRASLKINP
mmetsp:Transcript_32634/g.62881  ORF Transcript_32634/g.62881 Transcript_32634/m.62881 type:complete len:285 (-) Transcript_32634:39-893(-)